ncbi:MAG: transporter substrate-binding domain-containing protein [Bacilli bacterium]|nr:transporter substrate-binding domain-containing protein [Bacilli bacterium]
MKKILTVMIAIIFGLLVSGCSKEKLNFGKELVKVDGMIDILTELQSKNSDVGVMDSIMAGYYINKQYSDKLMIIPDLELTDEKYGIAARKDGAYTAKMISKTIIDLYIDGTVQDIANKYGLIDSLAIDENTNIDLSDETGKSDFDKIINSGTLVIGYTIFAPIAYEEENELIGFDVDLAKAVCNKLGVEVKFQLINWDTKVFELESGAIDVIWNGMTITDELKENTSLTIPYLKNKQVAVIRVEDALKYKTTNDMSEATIVVEKGSAGQLCVVDK